MKWGRKGKGEEGITVHTEREEAHRAGEEYPAAIQSLWRIRPFRSFSITYLVWAWARTPWKHPGRPSLPSRLTLGPEGEKGVIGK